MNRLLLVLTMLLINNPSSALAWGRFGDQMKIITPEEEADYIPLGQPPPPYSYKEGSMFRYIEDGKKMITFKGHYADAFIPQL